MPTRMKYRVHEVGKDFYIKAKPIVDILRQFDIPVKNHMQVLTTAELDIIFEYITQHSEEYAPLQAIDRSKYNPLIHSIIKPHLPIAIINWNDEDYYVAGIDPNSITRENLVETCANHAIYCENYQEAIDAALSLSQSYQVINMNDYPTPDLGAL